MKIKHTLTLFCVTLTLAFLLVSCADTSGDGGGGDTTEKQFSNVAAESCGDSTLELNCFISVWNTENSGGGASATNTIVLPLVSDGTYDFYVDWGDESEVEYITNYSDATHTYTTKGEYTIYIAGTIKGWRFFVAENSYGDAVKLLNVSQWGSLSLGNTAGGQFQGAEKFNPTATDAPDLSETTDLSYAFNIASSFNADISDWDVSKVTDMSFMFSGATSFNNNGMGLDWDDKTSKVTDMDNMFLNASAFNQDISDWNVGKVTASKDFATDSGLELNHVPFKFRGLETVSKEQCEVNPLINCFISVWNTANTGTGASAINTIVLPLVSEGTYDFYVDWGDESDVQKITSSDDATHTYTTKGEYTIHIAGTIKGWRFFVSALNQQAGTDNDYGDAVKLLNVTQWGSLSLGNTDGRQFQYAENFNPTATDAPDVSETTSLISAFYGASNFNGEIGNWDVSQVTNMPYMFWNASSFNNNGKPLDWGNKTSKVTNMEGMFNGASVFNQDTSAWDVENVTSYDFFDKDSGLELNNVPFKFRGLETVSREQCEVNPLINCFISVWNTDHAPSDPDITGFSRTKIVKLPLVEGGTYDFYVDWGDGTGVQKITSSDDVTHTYDTKGEKTIHIAGTIKGWRFFVANNSYGDAVKLLDVSQWGSLSLGNTDGRQFQNAENFNPTATDAPDLSETTDLNNAFASASNFNADISDWDVSQVTNMNYMFNFATNFNNNGKPLDWGAKTSKVTDMQWMFFGAGVFNHDISAWDVGEVTSMKGMFWGAKAFNQDISDWNVSQVTDMSFMFSGATSFNNNGMGLDWDDKTSKVTDMDNMFLNASAFNQDISGWNVSQVTNMTSMFSGASSFNNNGKGLAWGNKTSKVTNMSYMFLNASAFNQDVSGWKVENVMSHDLFATGSGLIPEHIPFKFRDPSTVSEQNCASNPLLRCFISVWKTDHDPTDTTVTGYSGTMSVKLPLVSEGTYDFYVDWGDESDVQKIEAYDADKITHTYTTKGEYTIHIAGTIKGWRFFVAENSYGDAVKLLNVSQWGSLSLGNTAGRQFQGAANFNPTATDAPDLSETTSLSAALGKASAFNQDISDWDVSQVTDMSYMFFNASSFNNNGKPLDWGNKTSKVIDMQWMFLNASVFNQDISKWDVANVMSHDLFATGSGIANKPEFLPKFKPQ